MRLEKKKELAQKRRWRVRNRIKGSAERPRLSIHFSNRHVYAQCIDDERGMTVVAHDSRGQDSVGLHANRNGAAKIGRLFAEKALAAGVESVVFDRGARRYHGCVAVFAQAARDAGLKF